MKNKKRIFFTASSLGSGLSSYFCKIAINLKKQGHDVFVLSDVNQENKDLSNKLSNEGIEHYRIKGLDSVFNFKSVIEASKILEAVDFDVIHTSGLIKLTKLSLAKILANKNKKPLVLQIDNISDTKMKNCNAVEQDFFKRIVYTCFVPVINSFADIVIPVSYWTKKRLENYGIEKNKMTVVHNGVDLDFFDKNINNPNCSIDPFNKLRNKTLVVQVSTLQHWKGYKYFLISAQKVLTEDDFFHFLIVGSGPIRNELENMAKDLGILKNITFVGYIPNYNIPWLLSKVDICVLATLKEQFPRVLLEYMAAKKPIVATNVCGNSEAVIDGVNGFLVPPRDPNSLAKSIMRLKNDPEMANKMGLEGRMIVEQKFNMNIITRKLDEVYESTKMRKKVA